MVSRLKALCEDFDIKSLHERKIKLQEIMEEIALAGLGKTRFFDEAIFHGTSALRIFYNLSRIDNNLEFSLIKRGEPFSLNKYLPPLTKAFATFGINIKTEIKENNGNAKTKILSIHANAKSLFLLIGDDDFKNIDGDENLTVNININQDSSRLLSFETKYCFLPDPYSITLLDKSSLFTENLWALLAGTTPLKSLGNHLYDFIFFLQKKSAFNIRLLEKKLTASKLIKKDQPLTLETVKAMLKNHFEKIDYKQAKINVLPFLKRQENLDIWSKEFFCSGADCLTAK